MSVVSAVTDEAVEAAVDVIMGDGHNGIECRPDRNLGLTVLAALEAAAPYLAPKVDREALIEAMDQEICTCEQCEDNDNYNKGARAVQKAVLALLNFDLPV